MNTDKVLILMRGVPSSGKSTRAKELAGDDVSAICSSDNFFGKTIEEYNSNWCSERLYEAHCKCFEEIENRLQNELSLAIVDNTNVKIKKMKPYADLAIKYQYELRIEEPTSPWWINDIAPYLGNKEKNRKHLEKMCLFLWEKNQLTHKVPLETIKKFMFRYAPNVTIEQLFNAENNII